MLRVAKTMTTSIQIFIKTVMLKLAQISLIKAINYFRSLSKKALVLVIGVVCCFYLSACQSIPSENIVMDQAYWQGMQEKLNGLTQVQLKGSFAFKQGRDRFSANFFYKSESTSQYSLVLTTPFGNEIARLNVSPTEATLVTSSGVLTDTSAEELFFNAFQMPLPLSAFQEIILGKALNDGAVFTQEGMLYENHIDNFVVRYHRYKNYQNVAIPSFIEITHPEMKLTIKTNEVAELK